MHRASASPAGPTYDHLATYLNDHFAGAAAALEALDALTHDAGAGSLRRFAADLRTAVLEDRTELEHVMRRTHVEPSAARAAVAWLGDKAVRLKMTIDDPAGTRLRIFELLEFLALGIEGKRALWTALSAVAVPELDGVDYARLKQRAETQRAAIETERLKWARVLVERSS
jgi:hypothetical protein